MIERLLNKRNLEIATVLFLFILNLLVILPKSIVTNNIIILIAYNRINHNYLYIIVVLIALFNSLVLTTLIFKGYKKLINYYK